jgi:endonuclease YncB( thermonuclease family)
MAATTEFASHTMSNTPVYSFINQKIWARVVNVHDGDTLTCIIEAFPECFFRYNIRLAGINTREIKGEEKAAATIARNRLLNYVTSGKVAGATGRNNIIAELASDVYLVFLHCDKMDKYGRILATVYRNQEKDEESINAIMIKECLAVKYDGGRKIEP